METKIWIDPLVQGKTTLFSNYSYIILHRHVEIKKIIMYYGRSQCALHHSILTSLKLFLSMNVQAYYGWITCYNFFALHSNLDKVTPSVSPKNVT